MTGSEVVEYYFSNKEKYNRSTLWWLSVDFEIEYDDNPLMWDCMIIIRHAYDSMKNREVLAQMIEVFLDGREVCEFKLP